MRIVIGSDEYTRLWSHLLPEDHQLEEAAFIFARPIEGGSALLCESLWLLQPADLSVQLPYHIELDESVRGTLIKQAHDTGTVVIELHSHLGDRPAEFSWSDLAGFDDWVPHVRWRLQGRPYGAVVVARDSFDGFYWDAGVERIDMFDVVELGQFYGTKRSPLSWNIPEEWHV